jgi:4,5-dihydroxyphthalate decarboxylase
MEKPKNPMQLKAMMGDYPLTHALHTQSIPSSMVHLNLADVKVANHAFKRTVRTLEFDVSELAIVTFLQAHEGGTPLVLLPAVIVSRFQHPFLMFNAKRGLLKPQDLKGKRIGVRSYAVTTVTWIRGMLLQDYGITPAQNEWHTFEDAHVESWIDPSNALRVREGSDMLKMLEDGQLDAAVLGSVPDNPDIQHVFSDPNVAGDEWYKKHQVIQINHMMTLKKSLCDSRPDVAPEIYRLLSESKKAIPKTSLPYEQFPFGVNAIRPHLEFVIDSVHSQGLIKTRPKLESLFHPSSFIL